jgi:proline iminopeptidase
MGGNAYLLHPQEPPAGLLPPVAGTKVPISPGDSDPDARRPGELPLPGIRKQTARHAEAFLPSPIPEMPMSSPSVERGSESELSRSSTKDALSGTRHQGGTVPVEGGELFVARRGAGMPMLVMHGGLGWDHQYLLRGLEPLGDQAQLVFYDHRGNGRSSRPEQWETVTHETLAADADALRERLGFDRIVLFGHSYGGYLAQEYALRYPERVAGLVLCTTAPALDFAEQAVARAAARATPEQMEALGRGLSGPLPDDRSFEQMYRTILPLYFHAPERMPSDACPASTIWSADAFNRTFFHCLPTFSTVDRLPEIQTPTLILSGDDDWIAPLGPAAERLHRGIPGSELRVFEQCGHFPFHEAPGRFRDVVAEWLSRVASQGEERA